MIWEIIKSLSILITAFLGVYGTLYDFRKDGKLTNHGKKGIIGIVVFGLISLVLQIKQSNDDFNKTIEANKQLKENIERQTNIIDKTEIINKNLTKSLNEQQIIINNVHNLSKETEENAKDQLAISSTIKKSAEETYESSQENQKNIEAVNSVLERFSKNVNHSVNRLSTPLNKIYFSYEVTYDSAHLRFPQFWPRLSTFYRNSSEMENFKLMNDYELSRHSSFRLETIGNSSKLWPFISESNAHEVFNSSRHSISFTKLPDSLSMEASNLRDLLSFDVYSWRDSTYFLVKKKVLNGVIDIPKRGTSSSLIFDFKSKSITHKIYYASKELTNSNNSIFSILDITAPLGTRNKFITIHGLETSYFKHGPPRIKSLWIHFDESGLNTIMIDGTYFDKIYNDSDFIGYACSLDSLSNKYLPKK